MGLARELAERIVSTRQDALPTEALYWSKVAVLDTVGVALAGSLEPAPGRVADALELPAGPGPCLIIGGDRRTDALNAALLNGVSAHVLDYDNTASNLGGHVSAVMVPALLAAAEKHGVSGRDLLAAHAIGFEAGRIGLAVNPLHSEKGWHPTWTIGVFAVTAACARLLELSVPETETALAIATSLAGGTKANFGTMTKSLHAGLCARNGLFAAGLARKGFTANPEAFEHKQGFFNVFNGKGQYEAARILDGWGEPYDIVSPGASYKLYPCCYSTHAAIQAALDLVQAHGRFDPDAIAQVESRTSTRALAHTDRPDPRSELDAKFSVQYCVARALMDGRVVLEHFEQDAYLEPAVRRLLTRVRAAPYTGVPYCVDDPFDAELDVTMVDGRRFTAKVDRPLGRTAENPIPMARIRDKFDNCSRRVLSPEAAAAVVRAVDQLDRMASVSEFMSLLDTGRSGSARSVERDAVHNKAA